MRLQGKRIGMMLGPGFEELEHWVVYMRMKEEGANVTLIGVEAGETHHGKQGSLPATSDTAAVECSGRDFDAILVPGGYAPDKMRRDPNLVRLVREAFEQDTILGLICHAGSMAISAAIVANGMKATGSLGIKDDLVAAGAEWVDEGAFREGPIVWGRHVDDLPAYCRLLVQAIEAG
jgi:protease I